MIKLVSMLAILLPLQMIGVAQPKHADRISSAESFLVDRSKPYVYLEVDHAGPREPRSKGEPKVGIWLRLHNNCTVPIAVRTFGVPPNSPSGEIGVLDNVVANPPPDIGDGNVSYERWPIETSAPGLPAIPGTQAGQPRSAAAASSKALQNADLTVMPHGYMFPDSSFVTVYPGHSIFSVCHEIRSIRNGTSKSLFALI